MKYEIRNDFPMSEESFNSRWEHYDDLSKYKNIAAFFTKDDGTVVINASYFMYVHHIGYEDFNTHVFDNCEDLKSDFLDKKYEQNKAEDHGMFLLAEQIGETITDDEILAVEYCKLISELTEQIKGIPA